MLHRTSEILVDEPHKFAVLSVKFKLAWPGIISQHYILACVIFSSFWNPDDGAAMFERRILNDVLVGQVFDAVKHHLVEKTVSSGRRNAPMTVKGRVKTKFTLRSTEILFEGKFRIDKYRFRIDKLIHVLH